MISDLPATTPEIITLIRCYASQGESGIVLIASIVDVLKRERDRAESLSAAYLTQIVELGKRQAKAQRSEATEPPEPRNPPTATAKRVERAERVERVMISADLLDI